MRPETQKIVADLEQKSGYPVHVVPVRDLGVVARANLSPRATDSYVVQYRPGIPFLDFAVAVQCTQILRLLALPERDRRQFGTTPAGVRWGIDLVKAQRGKGKRTPPLPESALELFASNLVGGLLTQLRSIPVMMRINASLAMEYPTFAGQQAESIALEQREALGCLDPGVRMAVPEEIVAGSLLMNTAYALFCDRLLGSTTYQVPYVAAGFEELGMALLRIFDEVPSDPASDGALVDRWAAEIGLIGKYQWVPLEAPSPLVS